jgi:probable HAF family extracellular repeat protein
MMPDQTRTEAAMIRPPWPSYVIIDLGTLGGESIGLAINTAGMISGVSFLSSTDPHSGGVRAFRYADGVGMIDVGVLPNSNMSWGYGINSGGLIVGPSLVNENGDTEPHAFVATNTLLRTDLGSLGGGSSIAWDINDQGQITGESSNAAGESHAFLWTSAGMRDIETLGGNYSVGRSVNDRGQVAGESNIGSGQTIRAFRFTEGEGMIDLGTLGGTNSRAYGINNSGQVVGESDTGPILRSSARLRGVPFLGTRAFLWTEGVGMTDLGDLGGGTSGARAISNNGMVVGASNLMSGIGHAFFWTRAGGMIDLNTLLPLNSGWILTEANGVNDKGQITGLGLHNGASRAFRLGPLEIVNSLGQRGGAN